MALRKIIITGGFGFVGQALIDLLQKHGDLKISVLDNGLCGGVRHDVDFIYGDIRDDELLSTVLNDYDTIVHLAAIVGEPACSINPAYAFDVNVRGTRRLLDHLTSDQHFIFASSSSVYGNRENETVFEDSELKPLNTYAQNKVHCEQLIKTKATRYTILRPVTSFGLTRNPRIDVLINTLIFEALTTNKIILYEPDIIRPMLYVQDYARALKVALYNGLGINQIYNLGDPELTMTKRKLVEYIAGLCNVPIETTNQTSLDKRNYDISFDKIRETGFTFTKNALLDTYTDMSHNIRALITNKDQYNRPETIRAFLKESNVHNQNIMPYL